MSVCIHTGSWTAINCTWVVSYGSVAGRDTYGSVAGRVNGEMTKMECLVIFKMSAATHGCFIFDVHILV